jgi:hypothetical protein
MAVGLDMVLSDPLCTSPGKLPIMEVTNQTYYVTLQRISLISFLKKTPDDLFIPRTFIQDRYRSEIE